MPSTETAVRGSQPPRPLWADVSKLSPTVACPEVQEVSLLAQRRRGALSTAADLDCMLR